MDIITTIGPASEAKEIVRAHIKLGVSGVRFTFSKETPEIHAARHALVKGIARSLKKKILSIADIPGGKPRLNNSQPLAVRSTQTYRIGFGASAKKKTDFFLDPPLALPFLKKRARVPIGDGENAFLIRRVYPEYVEGNFMYTGELERRRAFLPSGTGFRVPSFTEKDKEFCRAAQRAGFDALAVSFVDTPEDVSRVRAWLASELNWQPALCAKIETARGVQDAFHIAKASDGVMVARGDLAVQVGFKHLWEAQRNIMDACRKAKAYTIVATGLLDSLDKQPFPTRSECIDIATAREMGACALLLSAETTIGARPIEAVAALRDLVS